jgi:signal peptidase I
MKNLKSSNKESGKETCLSNEILDWAKYIFAALVFVLVINNFVIVNASVPSGSMENTIMTGDRIIANRLYYKVENPQRGDIVVFKFPDDESKLYVKRIIGLPGETVLVKNGSVYINDKKLDEPYLNVITEGNFGPFYVPEGKYFMLGDNRNNSLDLRYWENKFVDRDKIQGKAVIDYFPKVKCLGD